VCGAESEKRLIKKCRELNSEIVANAAKVQTALKLSEEDQSTIAALKKEIEKAWKLVDASHEKEARAKETIQQLKLEITNLSRLVEQGAGLSLGQEQTVRARTAEGTPRWGGGGARVLGSPAGGGGARRGGPVAGGGVGGGRGGSPKRFPL